MGDNRAAERPENKSDSDKKTDGHLRDDAYGELRRTGNESGAKEEDPLLLIQQAHEIKNAKGFAAAKPLFEQAISAADKVDMKMIDQKLKEVEEALKRETDTAKQRQLQELGATWSYVKQAPVIYRFQMGLFQNQSGDFEGAKASFDAALAKNPEVAKEAVFNAAVELNNKKEIITEESFNKAAALENPHTLMLKAEEHVKAGNNKSAEEQLKRAIEAADKLPMDQYRQQIAALDTSVKVATDPVASQRLLDEKRTLEQVVALPVSTRLHTAIFYLKNAKPDQAKELLEQALQRDPNLKNDEGFRNLVKRSSDYSSDTVGKTAKFFSSASKELLSDGISGGVGLAAFSLTPGGRLLKLGSSLLAGGATKHALSVAGLGGDADSPVRNFVWGGVNSLAMISGASVRQAMMGSFEKNITTSSARGMLVNGGITQAEKLSVFESRFAAEHIGDFRRAATVIEGKSGLDALKTVTTTLTENAAAKRSLAQMELSAAVKAAPGLEKPLVWLQGKSPLLWKLPNERLAAFQTAQAEYLAARGTSAQYLNPVKAFQSPAQFNGSLKDLQAITFWNRYKIDAASVGVSSLIYRGTREAVKVGDTDPATGKEYSSYDAVVTTAKSTASDAALGGLLIGGFRGLGGGLGKALGLGDVARGLSPGVRSGLAILPTSAGLFSPQLNDAYKNYEGASHYERTLAQIQKPIEDKNVPAEITPPIEKKRKSDVPE